jgi:rubrerythrin
VPSPDLTVALGNRRAFARFALRLEAETVTAYAEAAATIRDAGLRQPLGSIMACEAAHRVALRDSLGERSLVD